MKIMYMLWKVSKIFQDNLELVQGVQDVRYSQAADRVTCMFICIPIVRKYIYTKKNNAILIICKFNVTTKFIIHLWIYYNKLDGIAFHWHLDVIIAKSMKISVTISRRTEKNYIKIIVRSLKLKIGIFKLKVLKF